MPFKFHNPKILEEVAVIDTAQNQVFNVRNDGDAVILPGAQIDFSYVGKKVHSLKVGTGLAITGDNSLGQVKRLQVTLNGPDFLPFKGKQLLVECHGIFTENAKEVIFKADIV